MSQKSSPKSNPANAMSGLPKTQVNVRGNISAKRDVIIGEQYNDFRQQIANIATPAEFIAQAQAAQAHLAALKQTPELLPAQTLCLAAVEEDVKEVVVEASKSKPMGERINTTLTGAKETLDKLGGSVKSAVELGAALGGLAQIALKLFGG